MLMLYEVVGGVGFSAGIWLLLLYLITAICGVPKWIAYIIVQLIVYPMSFVLQRKFVFGKDKQA